MKWLVFTTSKKVNCEKTFKNHGNHPYHGFIFSLTSKNVEKDIWVFASVPLFQLQALWRLVAIFQFFPSPILVLKIKVEWIRGQVRHDRTSKRMELTHGALKLFREIDWNNWFGKIFWRDVPLDTSCKCIWCWRTIFQLRKVHGS